MIEHRGPPSRSALCEEASVRYGKECRITHEKESSESDSDVVLIESGLNPTRFSRILPKLTGIHSDSTISNSFTGFQLLPIKFCWDYDNSTESD